MHQSAYARLLASLSQAEAETLEQTRARLHAAQTELSAVQRQLQVDSKNTIAKLTDANKRLTAQFEAAQSKLKAAEGKAKAHDDSELEVDLRASVERGARLDSTIEQLEKQVLELRCENLSMKFDVEHSKVLNARLEQRLREMTAFSRLYGGGGAGGGAANGGGVITDETGKPVKASELGAVIESMKRVIERLQKENAVLARNAHSATQYMKLQKDNEKLKKDLAALRGASAAGSASAGATESEAKAAAERERELARLAELHAQTRKQLKKETDSNIDLKKRINRSCPLLLTGTMCL